MLLIGEVAVVVDHLEGVATLAVGTSVWLEYAPTLDVLVLHCVALETLERCFFHFWDYVGVSNDNTLDRD